MKVTKNIDYCCLAYRSVQHLFIPCDTIIRSFKLAARYRMQAQNSVCSKVCAGYQFDCFWLNINTQRVKLRHLIMLIFDAMFLMFIFHLTTFLILLKIIKSDGELYAAKFVMVGK